MLPKNISYFSEGTEKWDVPFKLHWVYTKPYSINYYTIDHYCITYSVGNKLLTICDSIVESHHGR